MVERQGSPFRIKECSFCLFIYLEKTMVLNAVVSYCTGMASIHHATADVP